MIVPDEIKNFYSKYHFPGPYTLAQIDQYKSYHNNYIGVIEKYMQHNINVLDVGCGTGYITNLFANTYKSHFTGIDFSTACDQAELFAQQYQIKNVKFIKQDFFDYIPTQSYELIIANSFLTHVPDYKLAMDKIKSMLTPGGTIILGMYNTYGNFIKKFRTNFGNQRLYIDQKMNPFETAFTNKQTLNMCSDLKLIEIFPSINNCLVDLYNLFNSKNGGLTLYVLKDHNELD
jgi:2-polyprenyl-3-methyl-5-hydroxy-6-metoxy-1,4-benzoquinol methylase